MANERIYINQLIAGRTLDDVFLVSEKDLRTTKTGGLYLTCTLCDKTGTLPARMWQVSESIYNSIPSGGFLHVKGRCEDYKGSLQFIIDACRPRPADKVDLSELVAVSQYDPEQMWAELLEILRGVKNKSLRLLVKKFVEDRELVERFKKSPAAMKMHHPFIGGLLEHTLNVARAAKALLGFYPKLNADLVLVGVFLHDIGKIEELSSGTAIDYTESGRLVGHITTAAMWVRDKAAEIEQETSEPFSQRAVNLLQHIILSHHGEHEFGSPKLPAIPESFFIHYLDNLDP